MRPQVNYWCFYNVCPLKSNSKPNVKWSTACYLLLNVRRDASARPQILRRSGCVMMSIRSVQTSRSWPRSSQLCQQNKHYKVFKATVIAPIGTTYFYKEWNEYLCIFETWEEEYLHKLSSSDVMKWQIYIIRKMHKILKQHPTPTKKKRPPEYCISKPVDLRFRRHILTHTNQILMNPFTLYSLHQLQKTGYWCLLTTHGNDISAKPKELFQFTDLCYLYNLLNTWCMLLCQKTSKKVLTSMPALRDTCCMTDHRTSWFWSRMRAKRARCIASSIQLSCWKERLGHKSLDQLMLRTMVCAVNIFLTPGTKMQLNI